MTASHVPSKNRAAIVLFPGATRPDEARMLIRHGYGVLLLDPRGQGSSKGDIVRWAGDRDLLAAAEYLRSRPDVEPSRIGAFGFSVGGEILLEAAAQSTHFKAVSSEGAGFRIGPADACRRLGIELVAPPVGIVPKQPEYQVLARNIAESNADLVFYGGIIQNGAGSLWRDIRTVAPAITMMGPDTLYEHAFLHDAGSHAEGTLITFGGVAPALLEGDLPAARLLSLSEVLAAATCETPRSILRAWMAAETPAMRRVQGHIRACV